MNRVEVYRDGSWHHTVPWCCAKDAIRNAAARNAFYAALAAAGSGLPQARQRAVAVIVGGTS